MSELYELLGSELFVTLLSVLVSLLGAGLTWLSKKSADYIQKKIENENLSQLLTQVNEVVFTSVNAALQEQVEEIKERSKDGKLSKEEAKRIKENVVNKILSKLSDGTVEQLDEVFGDVKSYIKDKVEAEVKKAKNS